MGQAHGKETIDPTCIYHSAGGKTLKELKKVHYLREIPTMDELIGGRIAVHVSLFWRRLMDR